MVHAEVATPFVLNGKQDYPLSDLKFRVRFVEGTMRTQKLEYLLDRLLDERAGVCQCSFQHRQDLSLVDVGQILSGLDLPVQILFSFHAENARSSIRSMRTRHTSIFSSFNNSSGSSY